MLRNTVQNICQHCGTLVESETPADQLHQGPEWERFEGTPAPLGVSWLNTEQAYNFAIDAVNASRVTLLLFREQELETPACCLELDPLKNKSGSVWHCRVPLTEADGAVYYAYKIDGPAEHATGNWHVYDPAKILVDPYARSIFFPTITPDRDHSEIPHPPLGRLDICRCPFDWKDELRVCHGTDLIIYEMHVRGFTQHPSSGIDDDKRGTFAGVVEKIPYLKELGVTAVELMPVFQFDPFDENYWGYMPLNFFAPHNQYSTNLSSCEQHSQFREMVRELHSAGIEVILDVVYNHTGELSWNRQCHLLCSVWRSECPLCQLQWHRKHTQHFCSDCPPPHPGQLTLLGQRDACGRVSVRPGFRLFSRRRWGCESQPATFI